MGNVIVGIDLGTTNYEIAAFVDGQIRVLGPGATRMLPSCVGFSASGELLVGEPARNQQLLYPERTVRSIKRRMGTAETVSLDGRAFTPQEISAIILRELVEWAHRRLDRRPEDAVITVPAYFSDAQRNATREAGSLAGLHVVRILNEPTAASLAYGYRDGARHTALVYDLGGGTFDVSIVTIEGDVTEVLASHGNNHLGGDDFDDRLLEYLVARFQEQHGLDLRQGHTAAMARLRWAAEAAKKMLSDEPYASVREEALVLDGGTPLHLEVELSRDEYEAMIRPLVESTLDSVSKALQDASKRPADLDAILLVGGSTRTPLSRSSCASVPGSSRARTSIRTSASRSAPVCSPPGCRAATLSGCSWTSRPIPSASPISASEVASRIRTATARSSSATRRCRSRGPSGTRRATPGKPRRTSRSTKVMTRTR